MQMAHSVAMVTSEMINSVDRIDLITENILMREICKPAVNP